MGFTIVTYLTKYSFHKNLPNISNSIISKLEEFIKQDQNYKSNYDDSIKDLKSLITLKE